MEKLSVFSKALIDRSIDMVLLAFYSNKEPYTINMLVFFLVFVDFIIINKRIYIFKIK